MTIKLITVGGKVFEGEVYAIDPVTKAIALQQADGGYIIVNTQNIQQIQGDLSKIKPPDANLLGLSLLNIDMREDSALKQAQKIIASLNSGVSSKIQALYDKFNLMYPCRWEENSIVVLDEYCIQSPYDKVTILKNCEGKSIDMFTKMLEKERRRLQI